MPEVIANYDPGADITAQATAAVIGGRCVNLVGRNAGGPAGISDTGDGLVTVNQTFTAGGLIFGVASHDAANGGRVNCMRAPKTVPIECNAAVAVGVEVSVGTDGRIGPVTFGAAVRAIGRAISGTSAAGQYVMTELYSGAAGPQGT